jgi:hypothetical protein
MLHAITRCGRTPSIVCNAQATAGIASDFDAAFDCSHTVSNICYVARAVSLGVTLNKDLEGTGGCSEDCLYAQHCRFVDLRPAKLVQAYPSSVVVRK